MQESLPTVSLFPDVQLPSLWKLLPTGTRFTPSLSSDQQVLDGGTSNLSGETRPQRETAHLRPRRPLVVRTQNGCKCPLIPITILGLGLKFPSLTTDSDLLNSDTLWWAQGCEFFFTCLW